MLFVEKKMFFTEDLVIPYFAVEATIGKGCGRWPSSGIRVLSVSYFSMWGLCSFLCFVFAFRFSMMLC